ncbi:hypothetical protein WAI453_012649 [Rhynchosporium graminicola]
MSNPERLQLSAVEDKWLTSPSALQYSGKEIGMGFANDTIKNEFGIALSTFCRLAISLFWPNVLLSSNFIFWRSELQLYSVAS